MAEEEDPEDIVADLDDESHDYIRLALDECGQDDTCDLSKIHKHMADRGFDPGYFQPFLSPKVW